MLRYLIVIGLIFLASNFSYGASKAAVPQKLKLDTINIKTRHFNEPAINKLKSQPDFNYYVSNNDHIGFWTRFWNAVWQIWDRFWQWVAELLQRLFGNAHAGKSAATTMKYLILIGGGCIILYVILKILGIDLFKLRKKKTESNAIPYAENIENIHEISFDEAIENAIQVKNYRLAIRLLYLSYLKLLSDADLIQWKKEKTNSTYVNELTDEAQRRQFGLLTRQFEYVWYGDFHLDSDSFQNIKSIFNEFRQLIR